MSAVISYSRRFGDMGVDLKRLPYWARSAFLIVTLPGIVLVALSIVALVVSVAALLFVAVPMYLLLRTLTRSNPSEAADVVQDPDPYRRPAKRVDVIVQNPGSQAPDEVNGE